MIKHLTSIELDIGNSDSNRNSNRKKKFIETYVYVQVLLSSVHTYHTGPPRAPCDVCMYCTYVRIGSGVMFSDFAKLMRSRARILILGWVIGIFRTLFSELLSMKLF